MQANNKNLSFRAALKQQSSSAKEKRGIAAQAETGIPRFTRNDNDIVTPTVAEGSCDIYPLPHQTPQPCLELLRSRLQNAGFTLVELAIALMVIGLLIGGVLKGQELIENAKITATIRQFKAYETATMIFRNTYNALPGDIKRPNRIPNCNTDDDNACGISGNDDGKIQSDGSLSPGEIESYNFFPHLTKAGMIQGPEGGTTANISAMGSGMFADHADKFLPQSVLANTHRFLINYQTGIAGYIAGHVYEFALACKYIAALDEKMDDGKPLSGGIVEGHDCLRDDGEGNIGYDRTGSDGAVKIPAGF